MSFSVLPVAVRQIPPITLGGHRDAEMAGLLPGDPLDGGIDVKFGKALVMRFVLIMGSAKGEERQPFKFYI